MADDTVRIPFRFMDLPDELRLNCLKFLFPEWSLRIKKSTMGGRIIFTIYGQPRGVDMMTVSQTFRALIRDALIIQYDKKLELCAGTHQHFAKMRQRSNLDWLTNRIETLHLHIKTTLPQFDYHFKFPNLRKLSLDIHYRSARWPNPLRTVEAVLINGILDREILQEALIMARKVRGSRSPFRRILQKRDLVVNATWRVESYIGSWITMHCHQYVFFDIDLYTNPPQIRGTRAEVSGPVPVAGTGSPYLVPHILNLVW